MSTLLVIAGIALTVVAAFTGGGILLLALGVGLMWAGLAL